MSLGQVGAGMEKRLAAAFLPVELEIVDESAQHHGHAGARSDGESHFRVRIVAAGFLGKSRVERHRMINTVLATELRDRVHALAIEARAPGE